MGAKVLSSVVVAFEDDLNQAFVGVSRCYIGKSESWAKREH